MRLFTHRLGLLLLAMLALTVTACGGDDDDDNKKPEEADAPFVDDEEVAPPDGTTIMEGLMLQVPGEDHRLAIVNGGVVSFDVGKEVYAALLSLKNAQGIPGYALEASGAIWTSSDDDVVSISGGGYRVHLNCKKQGSAIITATATDESVFLFRVDVNIPKPILENVAIKAVVPTKEEFELYVGCVFNAYVGDQVKLVLIDKDTKQPRTDLTDITWTTRQPESVSVTGNGCEATVKYLMTGNAVVSAKAKDGTSAFYWTDIWPDPDKSTVPIQTKGMPRLLTNTLFRWNSGDAGAKNVATEYSNFFPIKLAGMQAKEGDGTVCYENNIDSYEIKFKPNSILISEINMKGTFHYYFYYTADNRLKYWIQEYGGETETYYLVWNEDGDIEKITNGVLNGKVRTSYDIDNAHLNPCRQHSFATIAHSLLNVDFQNYFSTTMAAMGCFGVGPKHLVKRYFFNGKKEDIYTYVPIYALNEDGTIASESVVHYGRNDYSAEFTYRPVKRVYYIGSKGAPF